MRARDRIFTAQVVASHTNLDAYDARTFTLGGTLERQTNIIWQKKWIWSLGGEFVATDERDTIEATGQGRRRTFLVAAAPSSLAYDGSDDLLNPTRGYRLSGRISPEFSAPGGHARLCEAPARRERLSADLEPDRAGRAGAVRIDPGRGPRLDRAVAAFLCRRRRSVRGYGYQKIGPVDVNGDPVGGRG